MLNLLTRDWDHDILASQLTFATRRRRLRRNMRLWPQGTISGGVANWFVYPDNLDQSWYIPYALASGAIGVNIGDMCYDAGSGVAYPAGQQPSQGSEAADQILFAKKFIGCATDGCLSTETNAVRQLTIRTEGVKPFNCPSQTFKIGDKLGVYSNGSTSPDPQQLDAANNNPGGAIAVVVPCPGNPNYYSGNVTQVYAWFIAKRVAWVDAGPSYSGLPLAKYATGTTTTTFTAAEFTGGQLTIYNSTATTPGSIATPTAAAMFAAQPNAFVGQQWIVRIINSSGSANTMTITADASVTLSGTTTYTIAQFAYRDFLLTFTSATTATMQAIGGGAAATN